MAIESKNIPRIRICSAADVLAMLRAGACCVDLYSAFIYEGWTVARNINRDLLQALGRESIESLYPRTPYSATALARSH